MRAAHRLILPVLAIAAAMPAAMAFAISLPVSTLKLAASSSTSNTLDMTVGLDVGLGNQNSTQDPTLSGSCSTTFDACSIPRLTPRRFKTSPSISSSRARFRFPM